MLELAGWSVQDVKDLDFTASRGVALREFPLEAGFADYMLFVERQAVGIVKAKKEGTTLGGVDTQSKKYLDGLPSHVQSVGTPLPFAYESTGVETVFRDVRDPDYRSRRVFSFHRPGTLLGWAREPETLRARLGLDPVWWTPESLGAKPPRRESTCRRGQGCATQRSSRPRPFGWPAPFLRNPSARSPMS